MALLFSTPGASQPGLAGFGAGPDIAAVAAAPFATVPLAGASLDLQFAGTGALDARITLTRASTASYFDVTGTMQSAANNAARFDYDPLTHLARGLLIEESRTNLLKYSADTSNGAAWFGNNAPTITLGAGAPDGSSTLNHWTRTTTVGSYTAQTGAAKAASSLAYALSAYAAAGTNGRYLALSIQGTFPNNTSAVFDLQAGTAGSITNGGAGFVGSSTITPIGGGKYRCTLATSGSDTTTQIQAFYSFNSNGTNQVANTDSASNSDGYIWGCQLEQAPFPTSYIATTAATATRTADVASMPFTPAYPFSLVGEALVSALSPNAAEGVAVLTDGTTSNRALIRANSSASSAFGGLLVVSGANTAAPQTVNTITPGAIFKIGAVVTAAAGMTLCGNGGAVVTAAGAAPAGLNLLTLGQTTTPGNPLNGWLRRLRYWPRAMGVAELQAMTT